MTLSEQEDRQLLKLKDAIDVPKRTRTRAEMLRLSHANASAFSASLREVRCVSTALENRPDSGILGLSSSDGEKSDSPVGN